jgi:hypothetical protein
MLAMSFFSLTLIPGEGLKATWRRGGWMKKAPRWLTWIFSLMLLICGGLKQAFCIYLSNLDIAVTPGVTNVGSGTYCLTNRIFMISMGNYRKCWIFGKMALKLMRWAKTVGNPRSPLNN